MSVRTKLAVLSVAVVLAVAFVAWSDGDHSSAARAFLRGLMRQLF